MIGIFKLFLLLQDLHIQEYFQESLRCLVILKSSTEDSKFKPNFVVTLVPGSGDHHDFFPENQGDALLLEVQNMKKSTLGRSSIPVSVMADNSNDKIRWWPIYHDDNKCVGKFQLSINCTITTDKTAEVKKSLLLDCETEIESLGHCVRKLQVTG